VLSVSVECWAFCRQASIGSARIAQLGLYKTKHSVFVLDYFIKSRCYLQLQVQNE
jgi:hypothetical protein